MRKPAAYVASLVFGFGVLVAPPAVAADEPPAPAPSCEEWQARALSLEEQLAAERTLVVWYDGQWSKLHEQYRADVAALDAEVRAKDRKIRKLRATIRKLRQSS